MDSFAQRKRDILSRKDKSSIGEWDKKIIPLCNKINSFENIFTSSSCSGRIILMIEQNKKGENLFLKVWHDKVNFSELKKSLEKINLRNKIIKFKLDSAIIHVVCRNLENAKFILNLANNFGWKNHSIISFGKNPVVELSLTEKIEFPIINKNKILVSDEFLKLVLNKSNEKLENGWKKIGKLEKELRG